MTKYSREEIEEFLKSILYLSNVVLKNFTYTKDEDGIQTGEAELWIKVPVVK